MQPKFQRKKAPPRQFFCQIKRETPLPPERLPPLFTFPLSRGYAFPPFRRSAAASESGHIPRSEGGIAGVSRRRQKGQEPILGVLSPVVPAGEHRHPRPPTVATAYAHFERKAASSGAPLYRRRLCHLLQIKQKTIYTMRHISRCANREVGFSSKNVAFSLALCAQYTV